MKSYRIYEYGDAQFDADPQVRYAAIEAAAAADNRSVVRLRCKVERDPYALKDRVYIWGEAISNQVGKARIAKLKAEGFPRPRTFEWGAV